MFKSLVAAMLVAVGFLGWNGSGSVVPPLKLNRQKLIVEYAAEANQATLVLDAESEEAVGEVEIRNPQGAAIFELSAQKGQRLALSEILIKTPDSSPADLFKNYPEGVYDILAQTVDGTPVQGKAVLSHELLAKPVVIYPIHGATRVPPHLTARWIPDPAASKYRLILEQDENDGLKVNLPAGSNSFRVPDGVLAPGTETTLEVVAVGLNGNCTLVEIIFTTQ